MEALKWIWTTGIPLFSSVKVALGRIGISLWQAVAASEALAALSETAVELAAALATLAASPAILLTAIAGLIAAGSYLVWYNWGAIAKVIGRSTAAVSREVTNVIGKLASVVVGVENGTPQDFEPAGSATSHKQTGRRGNGLAPRMLAWIATHGLPAEPPSLQVIKASQMWSGFQPGSVSLGRAVAMAMLTAPLLVAPAMANMSSDRATAQEANVSMVFNSIPTIVINACQPGDIEHRIAEALRQHREAIFVEWSRELQRRQRVEF